MGEVIYICVGCGGAKVDADGNTCPRCNGTGRDPNP